MRRVVPRKDWFDHPLLLATKTKYYHRNRKHDVKKGELMLAISHMDGLNLGKVIYAAAQESKIYLSLLFRIYIPIIFVILQNAIYTLKIK